MRYLVCALALVAMASLCRGVSAAPRSAIISEPMAQRYGLTRPWFTQIELDRGRSQVGAIVLYEGVLYAQTDRGVLHAIDAETGATLWARSIGRPEHPSLEPGVGGDFVALVNGSRLYVCNRHNGKLLYETEIDGAPGAGPCLSSERAYVPMVGGMVIAYGLQPQKSDLTGELGRADEVADEVAERERRDNVRVNSIHAIPLFCRAAGNALVKPVIVTQTKGTEIVAWPTDCGGLNFAEVDRWTGEEFRLTHCLNAGAEFVSQPTVLPPNPNVPNARATVYAASADGFVYAMEPQNGTPIWQFSTGESIIEPAVAVGNAVYVATQAGGLYCLDAFSGVEQWWAPKIRRFLATSKRRVYCVDGLNRLVILNAKTGALLDRFSINGLPIRLINTQTDRLYLATRSGLLQCLHEINHKEPLRHLAVAPKADDAPVKAAVPGEMVPDEAVPVDAFENVNGIEPATEPNDDPFDDDPFG